MSIKADVDRGLEIHAEQTRLKDELKQIENRLEAAGLAGEQVALNDEELEGRQFLAKGSGRIVPVIFTSDLLIKSFGDGTKTHLRIAQAAGSGTLLKKFFTPCKKWESEFKSGKQFRKLVAEVFDVSGPAFISACVLRDKDGIAKSQIKVDWSRASEVVA